MIIANKSKKILGYGNVKIFPGIKVVSKEDSEELQKFRNKLDSNPNIDINDEKITSLKDLSDSQAVQIINKTFNVKELNNFHKNEKRAKVLLAVEKQLEKINSKYKKKD